MKLYKTIKGVFLQDEASVYKLNQQWDEVINRDGLYNYLLTQTKTAEQITGDTGRMNCSRLLQTGKFGRQVLLTCKAGTHG
ncbi:hypothetical protein [Mucilaginibacter humi]|uniref:hypothetical protein n=1 Tax=Mucilaginibacter humi TaxID=2732510 RepID=UPI001C2E2372|nr:hypothetical protein [Mucilaginibacter humi]